ncbi:MAG: DNA polymerase III subunit delta [bacterium]
MSLRQFQKEKEAGFSHHAYLLYASDPYFLAEAERAVREGIDSSQRDFSLDVYDLDPASDLSPPMQEIFDSLNTFSFFAGKKSVIVRNAQKMKQKELDLLSAYLSRPSDASTLFLLYNDALKAAKKAQFSSCRIIALDLTQAELQEWLISYAKGLGISLSGKVITFLIDMLGSDAGLLTSEINKLSLLGRKQIEIRDAAGIISGEMSADTFEFTRALSEGDKKTAFDLARSLREGDVSMLLGAINWQFSRRGGMQDPESLLRLYRTLVEADTVNKSTGSTFPLELLIAKLLVRK